MTGHTTQIENRARTWLREAVRSHDTVTVSALRTLLSAIGNAEAVPAPSSGGAATGSDHVAGSVHGVGSAEAERRTLTDDEVAAIVADEIAERRSAMVLYGTGEKAHRLAAEIVVLEGLVTPTGR